MQNAKMHTMFKKCRKCVYKNDTQATQCKTLILLGKTEVIKHRATIKRHSVDNLTTTIEEKKEIKKYIFINKNIYIVQNWGGKKMKGVIKNIEKIIIWNNLVAIILPLLVTVSVCLIVK